MKAWHFVGETLRDGSPIPPDGERLVYEGVLQLCVSGYHASEKIIDALRQPVDVRAGCLSVRV